MTHQWLSTCRFALVALALLGLGCGHEEGSGARSDGGDTPRQRAAADFVSLSLEAVGSQLVLRAPGELVFRDDAGEESFVLTDSEYQQALQIVLDPEFVEAVAVPVSQACPPIVDGGYLMAVTWADSGTQATQWGPCMSDAHPYARLLALLGDLLDAHVDCDALCPEGVDTERRLCLAC